MLLSVPAIVRSGLRGGLIPTQAGLLSFSRSTTRRELPASKVVVSGLACGSPLARPLGAPSESRSRQAEATPSKMRKSADLAAICWYGGETGSPFISYFLHTLTARAVVRHVSKNSSSGRYARQRFLAARRRGPNNSTTSQQRLPYRDAQSRPST